MSLFGSNLKLIGLGVENDEAGPGAENGLPDGIHLRWLFKRDRGFPWYGYYLLRRPSAGSWTSAFQFKVSVGAGVDEVLDRTDSQDTWVALPDKHRPIVVAETEEHYVGTAFRHIGTVHLPSSDDDEPVSLPDGRFSQSVLGDFPLRTTIEVAPAPFIFDLYGLSLNQLVPLQIKAPPPHRYRQIRLHIGFLQGGTVTIFSNQAEERIELKSVTGSSGSIRTVVLRNDYQPYTVLSFSRANAVVLKLEVVFALGIENWSLADALKIPQPIRLPITHPDYPAGQSPEDAKSARQATSVRTFVSGQTFPNRIPAQDVPVQGTVEVTNGSPFVRGSSTNWDDTIEGLVLETDLDKAPHVIMRVLAPDRLVLARSYAGPSRVLANYSLNSDPFGQLYDSLALLVEGGPAASAMADRFLRPNYHPGGTALVQQGQSRVNGQETNWSFALEGMRIHFIKDKGKLRYRPESNIVEGISTNWTDNLFFPVTGLFFSGLPGSLLEIDGHPHPYIIQHVVGDERLMIHPSLPKKTRFNEDSLQTSDFRIFDRQSYLIQRVDTVMRLQLDRPYKGRTRKAEYVIRVPRNNGSGSEVRIPDQRILDIISLGSLSPMIAQALGLHVIDLPPKTDNNGKLLTYDYLLIADYEGFFKNRPVVSWANSEAGRVWLLGNDPDGPDLDAAITYNHSIKPALPPATPKPPKAYYLRDASRLLPRAQQPHKAPLKALAGLTWNGPAEVSADEMPALYHVWRQYLGDGEVPPLSQPDDPTNYFQLTRPLPGNPPGSPGPIVIAQSPSFYGLPERPSDWPRDLRYLDMVSKYGWFSYRISSIDLFGRYSSLSEPAPWWRKGSFIYGLPPVELHSFAVNIVDETAPPAPTGVEANVLDPADPYVQRDAAAIAWRESLPVGQRNTMIGLRVRWKWTQGHMQQTPDTTHFQICYHPHRLNVLTGNITQVDIDGPDHLFITTDISIAESTWHLKGAYMRVQNHSYRITRSYQAQSDPLRVRVENLGIDKPRPKPGASFGMALTRDLDSSFHIDYTDRTAWDEPDFYSVPIDAFKSEHIEPRFEANGQPLSGEDASVQGSFLTLPSDVDLSAVRSGLDYVHLPADARSQYYRIVQVRPPQQVGQGPQLWLADSPQVSNSSLQWTIGSYERHYEVLLPDSNSAGAFSLQLNPSSKQPVAYGHAGVTAHDVRGHSSPVSAPAKVYRVHRIQPDTPPPLGDVTDTENVYATPADYHGRSYHNVEWTAKDGHGAHVFRALDDAVFERDRSIRSTRSNLDPAGTARHRSYFPDSMNASRRNTVAEQLSTIAKFSDYSALDLEVLRVLRRLPGNETIVVPDDSALQERREELIARDWELRRTHGDLAPDDNLIPQAWSTADRQSVADELNILDPADQDAYEKLSNRALRVIAGLPGHTTSFTQITTQPMMAPADSYRDTLDGRSRNCYFYRIAYVDAGQNRSALSPSGSPIYLPNVTPPSAPKSLRAFAGNPNTSNGSGAITLEWTLGAVESLKEFIVYRTHEEERKRDVRLMEAVATIAPTSPPRFKWTDSGVSPATEVFYRIVAVDKADNRSSASSAVKAIAYESN